MYKKLEELMLKHNITIRTIPKKITHVYEKRHYKNIGKIKYIEKFKREMLVIEEYPKNGGKFLIEYINHNDTIVYFTNKKYFNSIKELINYLENK